MSSPSPHTMEDKDLSETLTEVRSLRAELRLTRQKQEEERLAKEEERRAKEEMKLKLAEEQRKKETFYYVTGAAFAGIFGTYLIYQSGVEIKRYMQMVSFSHAKSEGDQARLAKMLGFECPSQLTKNLLDLKKASTKVNFAALARTGAGLMFFSVWYGSDYLYKLDAVLKKKDSNK